MKRILLNDNWRMQKCDDMRSFSCSVPCSVYHTLMHHGEIEDPYYRENEVTALPVSDDDYCFSTQFEMPSALRGESHFSLCFEGIDTIAEITLNGIRLGTADNMHRSWCFDVTSLLQEENTLSVKILSPTNYIAQKQAERPLWGVNSTITGFPHVRKAHYMFGWDWGPQLPDMGIWRDVYLEGWHDGKIDNVYYTQQHTADCVALTAKLHFQTESALYYKIRLTDPEGMLLEETALLPIVEDTTEAVLRIESPRLWWARGYGEQPLYTACVMLCTADGTVLDEKTDRIGLRTVTVRQEPDEWGESFCINLNGRDIFAMGANMIPLDQLLPRCTPEKETQLLSACVEANFNVVRIWGGGYYPSDHFFDYCDTHGLLVWQDFMFACANYLLTDAFWRTTEAELRENIIRLRNHPSLAMWCGNNEIETAFETWGLPEDPEAKADYLEQFEHRMPAILQELDPQRFYWRSSPSAYGGCKETYSNHAGDMHYWEVWHSFKPFTAFRELYYRFCSEYGFESVPNLKTLLTVCDPAQGDLNLMSPVMEAHQKCEQGNEKLMYYLAQMMRYPESFEELIYSSQLMQAEYIRSSVEHMRRERGRCMGSVYWQLNDTNPVISWSSIDYCGRWKGLHHFAKRFHAPVLLSVDERDAAHPRFNLSNETLQDVSGTICWTLRNPKSEVVTSGMIEATCPALTAKYFEAPDLSAYIGSERDKRRYYLSYVLETSEGGVSSGNALFVVPKKFDFVKTAVRTEITEAEGCFCITLSADAFVKAVCLDCVSMDLPFSDNWFDLQGNEPVTVTVPREDGLTAEKLQEELRIMGTDIVR